MFAIRQTFPLLARCSTLTSRASVHLTARQAYADRLYTKRHEWISLDTDNKSIGTVGISEFAQEALGDVVYVELPETGAKLERGETAGAIESVKAASDIYAPVTGTVKEKNAKVEDTPTLINKSPYEKGWLFKLELQDASQLSDLMDEKAYKEFRSQEHEE